MCFLYRLIWATALNPDFLFEFLKSAVLLMIPGEPETAYGSDARSGPSFNSASHVGQHAVEPESVPLAYIYKNTWRLLPVLMSRGS